jgi:hypothetical protein
LQDQRPDRRPAQNHFIVGVVILALGCILLLDQIGILDAGRIFLFWPLILIYFGYVRFTHTHTLTGRFWGGVLLLLGISFQAEELGFSHVRFDTIWPVLLICAGILLILKRYETRSYRDNIPPSDRPPVGQPTDIPPAPPASGPPIDPAPGGAPDPSSNPPPVSAAESVPAATLPPAGAAPSSFHSDDPPPTHANFAGQGGAPRWSYREGGRDDFRRHVHDFGQRMDEFGERMYENWRGPGNYARSGQPHLNEVNIFWGGKKKIIAKNFTGGDVVAIFGGFDIDLSEADMPGNQIEIEVVSIFGGGEVRIPRNWEVIMETVGIFGGCSDRTWHPEQAPPGATNTDGTPLPATKRVIIKGVAIFGGLNIKN